MGPQNLDEGKIFGFGGGARCIGFDSRECGNEVGRNGLRAALQVTQEGESRRAKSCRRPQGSGGSDTRLGWAFAQAVAIKMSVLGANSKRNPSANDAQYVAILARHGSKSAARCFNLPDCSVHATGGSAITNRLTAGTTHARRPEM